MSLSPVALIDATAHLEAPLAIVDAEALRANAADLVRRAGGKPIRVASKSVRVRRILEQSLATPGFRGVMSYSLAESLWLVEHGIRDVLLAYPTTSAPAVRALVTDERHRGEITVMVDSVASLDLLDRMAGAGHPPIRVCLDVDASLRVGPLHLGVRRSPVRTGEDAARLAATIASRGGFDLVGVMFYEAQIAGMQDSSPAIRWMKRRSIDDLLTRRADVVAAVGEHADLRIVNGGGTGSLETTTADPVVTELTAGSGLFCPTLFDGYDTFSARPAAFFALDVTRKPTPDIATLFGGGYPASGAAGRDRLPRPVWPDGLELVDGEGTGEVQTPVRGRAAIDLDLGDRVLMRHAKAGEMCERFDSVALVEPDGSSTVVPTYRGEQRNFG